MTTYNTQAFTNAFNLYLQNPSLYPEPNWSDYVISGSVSNNGKTENVAVGNGANSEQATPPTVQDPNKETTEKNTLIEAESIKPVTPAPFAKAPAPTIADIVSPVKAAVVPTTPEETTQPKAPAFVSTNESLRQSILQERESNPQAYASNYLQGLVSKGVLSTNDLVPIASTIEFANSAGVLSPAEKNGAITIEEPAPIPAIVPSSVKQVTQDQAVSITNKTSQQSLSNSQILDIHNYVDQVSKTVSDATTSGAATLAIFANGKQVDSVNLKNGAQSAKAVLFEAIPDLQKQYGDISLQYSDPAKTTVSKVPLTAAQVSQIHSYTESVVQTVQEAKASGAKSIFIVDGSGNKIDSIPVNDDTTGILFYAIPAIQKNVKGLSLEYVPPIPQPKAPSAVLGAAGAQEIYGNPFNELVKGTNEGTNSLIGLGQGLFNFVSSGGKNTTVPNQTPDALSSLITSPIVETQNATTGKVSTSVSLANVKTNLASLAKSFQQDPARQIGRLIPDVETIIGGSLVGEIPSIARTGASVLSKTPELDESITKSLTNVKIPSNVFDFDTATGSNFKTTQIDLGFGVGKSGSSGFSSTTIDLGRGLGGSPPTGTISDFYKAVSNLPKPPSKNAPLPSFKFSDVTPSEGETVVKSGEQNLITKTETQTVQETKQETVTDQVTKDLQTQNKKLQKSIQQMYQVEEPKTKTTVKSGSLTDQANKAYLDTLTKRKLNLKALIPSYEDTQFIQSQKVEKLTGIKTGTQNIFEIPQKTDIFEIPKTDQKTTTDIIQLPKLDTTTIKDIITIPKITTKPILTPKTTVTTDIIQIPKFAFVPDQVEQTEIIQIPTGDNTPNPKGGGGFGGGFNPPLGGGGGSENGKRRGKTLFSNYDISEDPLGISHLGEVQYSENPFSFRSLPTKARGNVDKIVQKMTGIKSKYNNSFGKSTKKRSKKRK